MRCCVLFGSPHKEGNTARLVSDYLNKTGIKEADFIYAYEYNLGPCVDCGGCRNEEKCRLDDFDAVKNIYERITSADVFILASPVYFNSAPAPLKCIIDRMQPYYIKKFVRGERGKKKPGGVLILSGGEKERKGRRDMLKAQYKYIFDVFGFDISGFIYEAGSDDLK
ncbi:MAG: flavodoxin family protein [Clostridia bacterium]|nr:flavodoxin family protein [Clostridia bacterium]